MKVEAKQLSLIFHNPSKSSQYCLLNTDLFGLFWTQWKIKQGTMNPFFGDKMVSTALARTERRQASLFQCRTNHLPELRLKIRAILLRQGIENLV